MDWDIKGLGLGDSGRLAVITKQTMGWGESAPCLFGGLLSLPAHGSLPINNLRLTGVGLLERDLHLKMK